MEASLAVLNKKEGVSKATHTHTAHSFCSTNNDIKHGRSIKVAMSRMTTDV
jgi:hypothetical protein